MMIHSPPASLSSSVASRTRQRSKSIVKKEEAVVSTALDGDTPLLTIIKAPPKPTRRRRRRRSRSKDDYDDDETFLAEPISSASLRRIGLVLAAGCLLFTWDLFHLMGYIERLDGKDSSSSGMHNQNAPALLRGNHMMMIPGGGGGSMAALTPDVPQNHTIHAG